MLVANDIASVYAGIVFGISNTLGAIPGIISPYIVGILTEQVCLIALVDFERIIDRFLFFLRIQPTGVLFFLFVLQFILLECLSF